MRTPVTPSSDSDFAARVADDTEAPRSERLEDASEALMRVLTPGTLVAEKYRIEEQLGVGGMGLVVAARHLELDERVALKFLLHPESSSKQGRARFYREAKVCARIRNEHITRVLDVGTYKRWPFMVMEHLSGRDVRSILREEKLLPLPRAIDYAVQLCEGLAEAHAHAVVHRDLKPTNLFITRRSDGTELLKILDFGISKWTVEADMGDDLTQTGVILGTPRYMAPEQLLGCNTVDARADVWSVGAILYELISGKPPYEQPSFALVCAALANGQPPPPIVRHGLDVPHEIEDVVRRCLEPDVARRIQNVADLAGDLLEAAHAGVAAEVRARLSAVLEGNTPSPSHVSSTSGSYASLISAVSSPRRAAEAPAPVVRERRTPIGWIIGALVVVGLLSALLMRRAPSPQPVTSTAAASSIAPTVAPPPVAPSPAEAVASAAPSATVTVATASSATAVAAKKIAVPPPKPPAPLVSTSAAAPAPSAPPKNPLEDRL